MIVSSDTIDAHLPFYLTGEQKESLARALADFYERPINYYISLYPDQMLQGDGWRGLEILRFEDGKRRRVKGIILSNTCDVAPDIPVAF